MMNIVSLTIDRRSDRGLPPSSQQEAQTQINPIAETVIPGGPSDGAPNGAVGS
ncbi:MAG: hypothetical protein ACFB0D_15835 [Phormidesmis sp.]